MHVRLNCTVLDLSVECRLVSYLLTMCFILWLRPKRSGSYLPRTPSGDNFLAFREYQDNLVVLQSETLYALHEFSV
jgi:hypothetical protein